MPGTTGAFAAARHDPALAGLIAASSLLADF